MRARIKSRITIWLGFLLALLPCNPLWAQHVESRFEPAQHSPRGGVRLGVPLPLSQQVTPPGHANTQQDAQVLPRVRLGTPMPLGQANPPSITGRPAIQQTNYIAHTAEPAANIDEVSTLPSSTLPSSASAPSESRSQATAGLGAFRRFMPFRRVGLASPQPIVRAQSPDPFPPPPPPPPPGSAFAAPGALAPEEAYNCGVVNTDAKTGGFWDRIWGNCKQCYSDVTGSAAGIFRPGAGRSMFQSDHAFDGFISPVTQPFYFEDPRALTEIKPLFIWQNTESSNPVFAGGNNFFAGVQGRVAFSERISLVFNQVGWIWMGPDNQSQNFQNSNGFSQIRVGPKFTIVRNDVSNTLAAIGLTFEVPAGASRVYQSTGSFSLAPYLTVAQEFGRTKYGTFHVMGTGGASIGIDSERTDFVFTSLHLDFDVLDLKKFYPLVELNWAYYFSDGNYSNVNFGGWDLFNFGGTGASGSNNLTIAVGGRYLISQNVQIGLAGEVNLLGGSRHMDEFRLTADVIFRY